MQSIFKITFRKEIVNIFLQYQKNVHSTSYRYISSVNFSRNNHDNGYNINSRNSMKKYTLIFTSAIIGYALLKNKSLLIPSVEAAIPANKLHGRRQQFNFISDVVEQAAPSVVYIEIKDMRRLDFFTGRPMTASNGSGFIIEENGLILTNAHVVVNKPNSRLDVKLHDGNTYTGIVEDVDLNSDLALVRIPCKNLPALRLGNSSDMRPGEFVVAIGSPLSLSNTCTSGVISSTNRGSDELGLKNKEMVYIQTDAAITFGNSGGPLMNMDGEAIGVNSMKVTAGISFAIPIDYVKSFMEKNKGKIKKTDSFRRRYMGITMLTLTPQIIHELHERQHRIPDHLNHGILVWKVIIGSPAHMGGLQPGDIVTHINDKPVKHVNDIYKVLEENKKRTLHMTIIRLGHQFQVSVTPEE